MKRKYRLKKTASNPFTLSTGILAIRLLSPSNCLIVQDLTYRGIPIQRHAYNVYNETSDNPRVKISASCNTANCVHREHLLATYEPTKKDALYIKDNLYMGLPFLSHAMAVPSDLLQKYIDITLK